MGKIAKIYMQFLQFKTHWKVIQYWSYEVYVTIWLFVLLIVVLYARLTDIRLKFCGLWQITGNNHIGDHLNQHASPWAAFQPGSMIFRVSTLFTITEMLSYLGEFKFNSVAKGPHLYKIISSGVLNEQVLDGNGTLTWKYISIGFQCTPKQTAVNTKHGLLYNKDVV